MEWMVWQGHEVRGHAQRAPESARRFYSLGDGFWIPHSFGARFIPDDGESMWQKLVVSVVIEYDPAMNPPERLIALEFHRGMGEASGWIGDDYFTKKPEVRPARTPAVDQADLTLPLGVLLQHAVDENVLRGPGRPAGEMLSDESRRYSPPPGV